MTVLEGAVGLGACSVCGAARGTCDCEALGGELTKRARALAETGMRAAGDGMLHRARTMLEQATILDTVGPAEWSMLGLCALATGDVDGAQRAWRGAEQQQPGGEAASWIESAERGAIRRGLDAYAEALQAARDSRLDEARTAVQAARAAIPDFIPAARLEGIILMAMGQPARAREVWRAAARVCRDDADLLGLLAESAEVGASPRVRRPDPTDLTLDEEELARVSGDLEGLDPEALDELATVEHRVRAGWQRLRTTTAEIGDRVVRRTTPSDADAPSRPATLAERVFSSPRNLLVAGVGLIVLVGTGISALRSGDRTERAAVGRIERDSAPVSAAGGAPGAGAAAAPVTPEAAAARALAAALGGNRDSLARAIAAVGDARRSWPPAVQQRAVELLSAVGRERYRAGRAAMAARRWDDAAAELGLATTYGAFTPYHDSAYYFLTQVHLRRGDSAAARDTARALARRYPSSDFSRDTLVRRLLAAAPATTTSAAPAGARKGP